MKKILILIAVTLSLTSMYAQFQGPGNQVNTVAITKNASDDTWVTLTGKIIKQVDHKKYIFQDSTGEITVEIKDRIWNGLTVNPDITVKITGEVDKDLLYPAKIEVKRLEVISNASTQNVNGGFQTNTDSIRE